MSVFEIFLIGIALSMDAFAVGIADGIEEPNMRIPKWFSIAFAFGFFQFGMPLAGYFCGAAFASIVEKIAPWLSFVILGVLGGKGVVGYLSEFFRGKGEGVCKPFLSVRKKHGLTAGKLLVQAIATSLDALAIGVTLLAAESSVGLPYPVLLCTLMIGATTFCISAVAVRIGNRAGERFSDGAELMGGVVLVLVGLKILIESFL